MTKKPLQTRARMQDVARAAGVSNATVSRVLNGNKPVWPELHERVIKAALELGFDLTRRNDSRIVAFLLSNRPVLHPFHSNVLVGAEAHCAAKDFGVLFHRLQYSLKATPQEIHIPQVLLNRKIVQGVIVAGTNSQNLLDALAARRLPMVCLGNNVLGDWRSGEFNTVFFDDTGGARDATSYLQSLGHREIWYVGNCQLTWFARRREGYCGAMEEAGLSPHVRDLNIDNSEDLGYLATKSILGEKAPMTAILAGDDIAARGAYRALADHDLKIPTDVSVIGIGDLPDASALTPPLTSVRVYADQLGKQMAELLFQQMSHLDLGPQVMTIPTQLIRRESCAPLPEVAPFTIRQEAARS